MKLLVAGGRKNYLSNPGFDYLDCIINTYKIDMIIQGGAKGIDTAAKHWAKYRDISCITVKAEWELYGKKSGWLRNVKMADMLSRDDYAVIFPGGRGSKMMLDIVQSRDILYFDVMNFTHFVRAPNIIEFPCSLCHNPKCTGLTCVGLD